MAVNRLIAIVALLGTFALPGTASAWLICDPCCKGARIQGDSGEVITGYRAAMSYANAGKYYFQGLIHLELSEFASASENFSKFYESADELRLTLDGADSELTSAVEAVLGETQSLAQLQQCDSKVQSSTMGYAGAAGCFHYI